MAEETPMLFLLAESELCEQIEDNPKKNAEPKVEEQTPIEGEDFVMENGGEIIFKEVVGCIPADDGHKDFGELADRNFHVGREAKLEFETSNVRGRLQ